MIKEKIISMPFEDFETTENTQQVPSWVKRSAGLWIDGTFSH